jgi:hypothetical protein
MWFRKKEGRQTLNESFEKCCKDMEENQGESKSWRAE